MKWDINHLRIYQLEENETPAKQNRLKIQGAETCTQFLGGLTVRISQWKTKLAVTVGYLLVVSVWYLWRFPCVFQALFGIVCPGCGMTRAVLAALRLDLAAAFAYHPMVVSLPLLYLYFLSDDGLFRNKRWDCVLLCGIGAGFATNWLLQLCG